MADSPWPTIHAERKALGDDLSNLTDAQWKTPSLCEGWDVHECLAHQVATAKLTVGSFFASFIGAGFNMDKMQQKQVVVESQGGPSATLAGWRAVESSTASPPGPKDSWLGEILVHAEDIRRPLGIAHDYPAPWVTRAIDFYSRSNAIIGGKKRVAGVTLKATDTEWSHGTGPLVEGPAIALLMAASGRKAFLDDLSGLGVETLRSR